MMLKKIVASLMGPLFFALPAHAEVRVPTVIRDGISTHYNFRSNEALFSRLLLECNEDPDEGVFYLDYNAIRNSFDRVDIFGDSLNDKLNSQREMNDIITFNIDVNSTTITTIIGFQNTHYIKYEISRQTGYFYAYVMENNQYKYIQSSPPIICKKIDELPEFGF